MPLQVKKKMEVSEEQTYDSKNFLYFTSLRNYLIIKSLITFRTTLACHLPHSLWTHLPLPLGHGAPGTSLLLLKLPTSHHCLESSPRCLLVCFISFRNLLHVTLSDRPFLISLNEIASLTPNFQGSFPFPALFSTHFVSFTSLSPLLNKYLLSEYTNMATVTFHGPLQGGRILWKRHRL